MPQSDASKNISPLHSIQCCYTLFLAIRGSNNQDFLSVSYTNFHSLSCSIFLFHSFSWVTPPGLPPSWNLFTAISFSPILLERTRILLTLALISAAHSWVFNMIIPGSSTKQHLVVPPRTPPERENMISLLNRHWIPKQSLLGNLFF